MCTPERTRRLPVLKKGNKESMTLLVAGTSPRQLETAPSCIRYWAQKKRNCWEKKSKKVGVVRFDTAAAAIPVDFLI